jgi:hypothetical protein
MRRMVAWFALTGRILFSIETEGVALDYNGNRLSGGSNHIAEISTSETQFSKYASRPTNAVYRNLQRLS